MDRNALEFDSVHYLSDGGHIFDCEPSGRSLRLFNPGFYIHSSGMFSDISNDQKVFVENRIMKHNPFYSF